MNLNQRNYELSKQLVRRFRRRLCIRCLEGLKEASKEQRGRIMIFRTQPIWKIVESQITLYDKIQDLEQEVAQLN